METYYDNECSVKVLGNRAYIRHPRFDAYLVSIVCDDGFEFCGHPNAAPWERISGPDWTWLSHNASFDTQVYVGLADRGIVSRAYYPGEWHCTSDLASYLGAPRSLAGAVQCFYGTKPDKSPRNAMKGKLWRDVKEDFKARFTEYALDDSRLCLKIWLDYNDQWPEHERRLSKFTRIKAWRGLFVDQDRVNRGIDHLALLCWAAEQKIPWIDEGGAALSYPRLAEECRKAGISCPPSTAMSSDECAEWEDTYGSQFPWIAAMRLKRRANAFLTKLRTLQRKIGPDGRMEYAMKYFGASITGRWSGDGSFNAQNLSRLEMFGVEWWKEEGKALIGDLIDGPEDGVSEWGVDIRKCFIPPPGFQFNIPDLSQIEPRCLWLMAGDLDAIAILRTGISPYEAHARSSMGWTGGKLKVESPSNYNLAKARCLALGYEAGWLKFISMAPNYISQEECNRIFSAPVSDEDRQRFVKYLKFCKNPAWNLLWNSSNESNRIKYVNSWLIVINFRRSNPKICEKRKDQPPGLWKQLHTLLQDSVGGDLVIELPSGRKLTYRSIALKDGEYTAIVTKQGRVTREKFYGGKLTENLIQALARDIFGVCLLNLDDAGIDTVLHVHDEAVNECPIGTSEEFVSKTMCVSPRWLPSIPLEVGCTVSPYYTK